MPYPPEFEFIAFNTNSAVFVEVLNLLGSGYLNRIAIGASGGEGEIRVTIDGYIEVVTIAVGLLLLITFLLLRIC